MATLEISDRLDAALQQAAERIGCTKAALLDDVVTAHLEQQSALPFDLTEAQLDRLTHSLAQLDRGECVPGEVVMAKFTSFIARLQAR